MSFYDNHMLLPCAAPIERKTVQQIVAVNIITPIVNIGRWLKFKKRKLCYDLGDAHCSFEADVAVRCYTNMMGTGSMADDADLQFQVGAMVACIDGDAEYSL